MLPPDDQLPPLRRPGGGPAEREARLRRRWQREHAARLEAEAISERITRSLYDRQQELMLLEEVAKAANEASSIEEARSALEAIRRHSGWALGHAWICGADGLLRSTGLWTGEAEPYEAFREATRQWVFRSGEGLPGRVLREGRPVWVSGGQELSRMQRGKAMAAAGFQTALCFPLLAGRQVVGVLEFYSRRPNTPGEGLLALMAQIGTQLGRVLERQRAAEVLRHEATHDSLTGLPNRVLILEQLRRALARQRRDPSQRVAVFFLDLDGFKIVNDSVGHAPGDRVLHEVAQRLAGTIRPHDMVGRLGGDEFVVVCEGLTEDLPVALIAQRLQDALRQPFQLDDERFLISASIGVALAEGGEEPQQLIEQADAAMYRSKELGRSRYEIYSRELRERLLNRVELERALAHALERDELRLHYQPLIDLHTGAVVGVEALMRWQRHGQLLMPADFIPLAEQTGLIVGLGNWALEQAARQARAWQSDPGIRRPPVVSVNLSVRQLADPQICDLVVEALRRNQLDPHRLCLEVTESAVLEDPGSGLAVLERIRALGVQIAIDDFGTGYASLSYLRLFPAAVLKIDRSFTSTLPDDGRTRAIMTAVVALSRELGLTTVAEGVETAEHLALVRELGCDLGQGYLFGRAEPAEKLSALLSGPPGTIEPGTRP